MLKNLGIVGMFAVVLIAISAVYPHTQEQHPQATPWPTANETALVMLATSVKGTEQAGGYAWLGTPGAPGSSPLGISVEPEETLIPLGDPISKTLRLGEKWNLTNGGYVTMSKGSVMIGEQTHHVEVNMLLENKTGETIEITAGDSSTVIWWHLEDIQNGTFAMYEATQEGLKFLDIVVR